MKLARKRTPMWLFLVPAIGLISFGAHQSAWAIGHEDGGNHQDGGNHEGGGDHQDGGRNQGGSMGGSCDVPEPGWYLMMAAGGLPMGFKLLRSWLGS